MADKTHIEWTDATWNVVTGCSVVSPGCTNCYAMRLAGTRLAHHPSRAGLTRDSKAGPVWTGETRFNEQWLTQPLQWSKPRTIFVCAHGDLFHESVPDEVLDKVFAVMALAHWHIMQVLTKRSTRMRAYCSDPRTPDRVNAAMDKIAPAQRHDRELDDHGGWPLKNVWLGVSTEDQTRADERVPDLLATPAAVRWVSGEPLLGPIDFRNIALPTPPEDGRRGSALDGHEVAGMVGQCVAWIPPLDWIVVGGESGPGARPMHPQWARDIRDQCAAAGVPYFHKQNGEFVEVDGPRCRRVNQALSHSDGAFWMETDGTRHPRDRASDFRFSPYGMSIMARAGKTRAGRLLDGRTHDDMPGRP